MPLYELVCVASHHAQLVRDLDPSHAVLCRPNLRSFGAGSSSSSHHHDYSFDYLEWWSSSDIRSRGNSSSTTTDDKRGWIKFNWRVSFPTFGTGAVPALDQAGAGVDQMHLGTQRI